MTVDPASLIYASFESVATDEFVKLKRVPTPTEMGLIKRMAVKAISLAPILDSLDREAQEEEVKRLHRVRKAAMREGARWATP